MMKWMRKKPFSISRGSRLRPSLTATDLVLMGIGAIIGAGIFVLTGVAAATCAGPAVLLSYFVAGLAALFAALSYAELSTSIGGAGSAYTYTYHGMGEVMAWIVGWNLLLEYAMGVSTVAIGWSSYVNNFLESLGFHLPARFMTDPFDGGMVNLPAMLIILLMSVLLSIGVKESIRVNAVIVIIKLMAILVFIVTAVLHVQVSNWHPFVPFGWQGVAQGASLVFFAYIGFDALSTAAEETKDPQKNLPIGIMLSLGVCTALYILVAAILTGITRYTNLNVASPVSDALLHLGYPKAAGVIALGAISGLSTVILVSYFGLSRICLAMSRDGLIPEGFAKIHPQSGTPVRAILFMGLIMAAVAGFCPIHRVAELVNGGTLTAFVLVCLGVIVIRKSHQNIKRPFRMPFGSLIPVLGILSCLFLMLNLSEVTWVRLGVWTTVGIVVYFLYGYRHSKLAKKQGKKLK